jgi:hypothetical protein
MIDVYENSQAVPCSEIPSAVSYIVLNEGLCVDTVSGSIVTGSAVDRQTWSDTHASGSKHSIEGKAILTKSFPRRAVISTVVATLGDNFFAVNATTHSADG